MRLSIYYRPVQSGFGLVAPGVGHVVRFHDIAWMKRRVTHLRKVPESLWHDESGQMEYIVSKGLPLEDIDSIEENGHRGRSSFTPGSPHPWRHYA